MIEKVADINDNQLIKEFVECAATRGKAALDGDNRLANQCATKMYALDKVFRERGKNTQLLLLPFLDNPNDGVRFWVAIRVWPLATTKAREVIEQIARGFDSIGATASGTLRGIDSGQFTPGSLWGDLNDK